MSDLHPSVCPSCIRSFSCTTEDILTDEVGDYIHCPGCFGRIRLPPDNTYRIECVYCHSPFTYGDDDVYTAELGASFVDCPNCGVRNTDDNPEHEKRLTISNLVYPQDFIAPFPDADSVKVGDVNKLIKLCLEQPGDFHHTHLGDTDIFVVRDPGLGEIRIYVSHDTAMTTMDYKGDEYCV